MFPKPNGPEGGPPSTRNQTLPAFVAALLLAVLCAGSVAGAILESARTARLPAFGVLPAHEDAAVHIWPSGINPAGTVTGYVLNPDYA
jgi:hypothetical protein